MALPYAVGEILEGMGYLGSELVGESGLGEALLRYWPQGIATGTAGKMIYDRLTRKPKVTQIMPPPGTPSKKRKRHTPWWQKDLRPAKRKNMGYGKYLYRPAAETPYSLQGTIVPRRGRRFKRRGKSRFRRKRKFRRGRRRGFKNVSKIKWSPPDTKIFNYTRQVSNSANAQNCIDLECGENVNEINAMMKAHVLSTDNTIADYNYQTARGAKCKYRISKRLILKNNYNFKVKLMVWDAFHKVNDNSSISTRLSNGIAETDIMSGGLTSSTFGVVPKDGGLYFKKYIKLKNYKLIEVAPGQEVLLKYKSKVMKYSKEHVDDEVKTWMAGMHEFFIIMQGTIVHDSTTSTTVGYSEGKLDVHEQSRVNVWLGYAGDIQNLENDSTFGTVAGPVHVEHTDHGIETAIE